MITETKVKKYKRKQYLVAKKFQLKYVGLILLLMFLTATLCSYVVYYTSMLLMGEKLANVYPQGRLVSIVRIVNFRILLSLILITPLVALLGIFLSHRIAGPIYRMERFMSNVASGNLTSRIILRRKDELITLADGINYVVESLRDTVIKEKAHLNRAREEIARLTEVIESKPIDQTLIEDGVAKLADEIDELNKVVEKYKV